jgi:hypothetical protein
MTSQSNERVKKALEPSEQLHFFVSPSIGRIAL